MQDHPWSAPTIMRSPTCHDNVALAPPLSLGADDALAGGRKRGLDVAGTRRHLIAGAAAAAAWAQWPASAMAKLPPGYPRSYQRLVDDAERERRLLIYSTADIVDMREILRAFRVRYPFLDVQYEHFNSKQLYDRYVAEVAARRASADLLFSSAMDAQIKLVNDGYAQEHPSPEKPFLPSWAVWKDQAYGLTAEPIVFAYNRRLLSPSEAPHSHVGLERLLRTKASALRGRVGTYDVERSSTGFLFFAQDLEISHDTWKLLDALGRTKPKLGIAGHDLLEQVARGDLVLAYNMMSSYALERHTLDPVVEVVFPTDYTLVMTRIAFVSREALHPAAAKLFLDFLISREGQSLLARRYMTPVRTDLQMAGPHANPSALQAIRVGPELLADFDRLKSARLTREWKQAVEGVRVA